MTQDTTTPETAPPARQQQSIPALLHRIAVAADGKALLFCITPLAVAFLAGYGSLYLAVGGIIGGYQVAAIQMGAFAGGMLLYAAAIVRWQRPPDFVPIHAAVAAGGTLVYVIALSALGVVVDGIFVVSATICAVAYTTREWWLYGEVGS